MTTLWRNFEKHRDAQLEASNTAVQAQISVLEREVAEKNVLLQARGEEIASKDLAASQMQNRISELEKEVANLKVLLQTRDSDIASKDSAIFESRLTILRLERELRAANEQCTQLVASLSAEFRAVPGLGPQLFESRYRFLHW
jgi:uncharacterized protein (DUF3084 family)